MEKWAHTASEKAAFVLPINNEGETLLVSEHSTLIMPSHVGGGSIAVFACAECRQRNSGAARMECCDNRQFIRA